jgi:hypothetical protein
MGGISQPHANECSLVTVLIAPQINIAILRRAVDVPCRAAWRGTARLTHGEEYKEDLQHYTPE